MTPPYDRPADPTIRRWGRPALFLVPVAWAAALLAVMRPDIIRGRDEVPFELKWLVYDESDLAALALRGANAHMGRLPGLPAEPEWADPPDVAARLDHPPRDYTDRYYLEYPTATVPLFRLGYLFAPAGPIVPPAVADAQHFGVAFFEPRNDAERAIWGHLRRAVRVHVLLMAAALIGLMAVLARGYSDGPRPAVWLCVLPGAVFFSLNRFDVVPALATAVGFLCLGRGRPGWSGAFFAVGALLKLYPVLFAPVILRYLGFANGARWLTGAAAVGLAGVGLSTAFLGWEPTVGPVLVQLSRPLEERSWTLYGTLLPTALGHSGWGRLAILGAVVLAALVTRPTDLAGVLRRCGLVLAVFVMLAVFWSPQWVVWFLPLTVPLAAQRRWVGWAAAALDLANYFSFPVLFWILWSRLDESAARPLASVMIVVRGGLWLWLAVGLARDEWRATRGGRWAS
ncbi:MAG: DUF2029 domain-containing protein [Gemmataceae bacterium]|nr:DUF2029 domain-containing protein [Gemmataceae bacterium]